LDGIGAGEKAFLDEVASGAGFRADDGARSTKEGVEQAGFAGIGRPGNDSVDAFAEDGAVAGGGEEGGNVRGESGQTGARAGGIFGREVFLGKSM